MPTPEHLTLTSREGESVIVDADDLAEHVGTAALAASDAAYDAADDPDDLPTPYVAKVVGRAMLDALHSAANAMPTVAVTEPRPTAVETGNEFEPVVRGAAAGFALGVALLLLALVATGVIG